MTVRNYRGTIEYDGTNYCGFQIQRDQPTIQGELERAIAEITREETRITGSGRTDSGVHAHGQVINFRSAWKRSPGELQRAINAVVCRDVAIREVSVAPESFHARFSAIRRTYIYSVYQSSTRSPLGDRFALHIPCFLDVRAMNQAASVLIGEHDFSAFGHPPSGTNAVRVIHSAGWSEEPGLQGAAAGVDLLRFEIVGNAFLRAMVRRIVGGLLAVGMSQLSAEGFGDVLSSLDIGLAEPPAPACGLCLWKVDYEDTVEASGI